ncbi:MAG: UPF0182 family protein [Clostridia bacterium]|nr:UPF0182 family protein [Clostridia bacterium]
MIDVKNFRKSEGAQPKGFSAKAVLIVAAALLIFLLWSVGTIFFDYIEIKEIGQQYTSVFVKNLIVRLLVQLISFLSIVFSVFLSILFVRRNLAVLNVQRSLFETKKMSLLISVVIAFILSGVVGGSLAEKLLLFSQPQQFGLTDPVFGKDIGYFVFQRPFLMSVSESVFGIWLFISAFVFVLYWFLGTAYGGYGGKQFLSIKRIAIHNVVNVALLLAINCVMYVFKAENILYGSFGDNLQGAGFTDKFIWLSYYRIAPILLIVLITLFLIFIAKNNNKAAIRTVLVYPAAVALTAVISFAVQGVLVSPNEVIKESENIAANIKYTQAAYGLDQISEVVFDVKNDLTVGDLDQNSEITDNIRILDLSANLTVLNQIQGIRNYYKFNETDIVPYEINGKKTAVAITPREITKENLSDSADTYINRTLRYTHGFGVTMNTINTVTAQGQPEFLIKDIPPKASEGIQKITQPRIYYGELTNDYVVVGNQKYKELDYSEDQEDIEFSYDGRGGLQLTPVNRLVFALKYGDIRLLISDLVSGNSRILINRNIIARLKNVAPFFNYDNDPYMVIDDDGSLKWVVDAYTTTNYYPYSQSVGEFNYIRNSVKAVVDAYNGDVTFYIADKTDPIVMCYSQIYPELFSQDDIPDGIKKHIKYPEFMFDLQSRVYGHYHISNPTTFYNKNDTWVIAKERYGTSTEEKEIAPYYNMMRLEDEAEEELLLTIPYTLANKDNMVAWLAVRNEWDNYGKLQVYKFPKDINIYGPMQVENRINSDANISKELNLWSQGGSQVIRGNMIVVPIDDSVLYVEPVYITSSNKTTLPELKQVVVAYDEKIVMKNNLSDALYALFNEKAPDKVQISQTTQSGHTHTQTEAVTYEAAAKRVIEEFENVKKANAENNWNAFGESMNTLEQSIAELKKSLNEDK